MTKAKKGDKVKIHYTAKLKNGGQVFDSSKGKDPLPFTIGGNEVIPKLEENVVGMSAGESKEISMTADEAYGQRDENLVVEIARDKLPGDVELKEGQFITIDTKKMGKGTARVVEVGESSVTIDANHPLAGQDLEFEIELVEIG